jgi:RNA polymerase sigma-54 factor
MPLELRQQLNTNLLQTLELMLSPKMLAMLRILNMSYLELLDKVKEEEENNVVLEVERKDTLLEYLKSLGKEPAIKSTADFDEELPGIENISTVQITLTEHLLQQLRLEYLLDIDLKIGEALINNLEPSGFIKDYPMVKEKIVAELKVNDRRVDRMLKVIQTFEPDGVGARDLKECLLIQVGAHNFQNDKLKGIIEQAIKKHLSDLGEEKFDEIAASLGVNREGAAAISDFIKKNLNPCPGSIFAQTDRPIIPTFMVEETDGKFEIQNLEQKYGPVLSINQQYLKMLESPETDEKTKKFIKEKFDAAKELIEQMLRRRQTMDQIAQIILSTQQPFFQKGLAHLNPCLQKDIAERLEVHPSTISRAIAEKYIQTPKGVFPIKQLCPRDFWGFTQNKIKALVIDLIKNEDKSNPLSDQQLQILLKNYGIAASRRTVAAYREELKIPSSFERKKN